MASIVYKSFTSTFIWYEDFHIDNFVVYGAGPIRKSDRKQWWCCNRLLTVTNIDAFDNLQGTILLSRFLAIFSSVDDASLGPGVRGDFNLCSNWMEWLQIYISFLEMHYSDITWVNVSQINGNSTVFEWLVQADTKLHNTNALRGESSVSGGSHTKRYQHETRFLVMTQSHSHLSQVLQRRQMTYLFILDCLHRLTSNEKSKFHITVPLWRESIGDRWIPLLKGQ